MEWRTVLENLEAQLARLQAAGINYLNIEPDPELARMLNDAAHEAGAVTPDEPAAGHGAAFAQSTEVSAGVATQDAIDAPVTPGTQPRSEPQSKAAATGQIHPSEFKTLDSLQEYFRDCRNCGLCAGRSRVVFGEGHAHPIILFVGEGPGQEEDRQGLPFVGRAGTLLTQGIRALGLAREDIYIANIVKCRPPGNRNPQPEEMAACLPILQRQIELLDPKVIVTLGNVPLKTFNPRARGITQARGHPFGYREWQILPTFHPAYLLRNPNGLDPWWSDLKQALFLANTAATRGAE